MKQHGKRSTYNRGCRCKECKRANTEYVCAVNRRKNPKKTWRVEAAGTAVLLQRLVHKGATLQRIAVLCKRHFRCLVRIMSGRQEKVYESTRVAVLKAERVILAELAASGGEEAQKQQQQGEVNG